MSTQMLEEDRDLIWGMVKESTLIFCRLFPECRGEAAEEMIYAYKKLYPERFKQESMVVQCFMCKTIQIRARFCVECGLMLDRANLVEGKRIIYRKIG